MFGRTALDQIRDVLHDAGYWFKEKGNGSLTVHYPDWKRVRPYGCPVTKGEFFVNVSENTILANIKKLRCTFHTGETAYLTVKELSKLLYKTFDIMCL